MDGSILPGDAPTPSPDPARRPAQAAPSAKAPKRPKRSIPGWMWAIVAILGLTVATLTIVCMVLLLALAAGAGAGGRLREQVVVPSPSGSTPASGEKLVQIDVTGIIMSSGGSPFAPVMSFDQVLKELEQARLDSTCRGVLLQIDSRGGSVTASDILYHEVRKLHDAGKVVVALYEGVAASGAVYMSAHADHIMAHPTTLTGSIGVLIQSYDASRLMAKIGVRDQTIKSGSHKDMFSFTRPMKKDEMKILQTLSDEMHERFIEIVAEGRSMDVKAVRALADGRIYSAEQAKAKGLIDSIGYRDEAVAQLRKLASAPGAPLVRYRHPGGLLGELLGVQAQSDAAAQAQLGLVVREALGELMTTRLMYLWRP